MWKSLWICLLWFVPGLLGFLFHRQYSLSVFTLDCDRGIPNFHAVMCKAVSAEIRLVDLSGSNFHGHGFDGNPNFHRLRELFTGMFLAIH